MPSEHIVVDGSNIATEGRSSPSLAQLEKAVAELRREYPDAEVTVVVDATFSHRIDPSELERFESAALEGEYVHPPAGAIGRGDAFLLRIAEKVDAIALSNDSFQEFHGEHPWLFERGRLLGATPVPGIGWIFTPRTPVRGPASRKAVRDTKDTDKAKRKVSKAIEAATKEAVAPSSSRSSRQAREPSRRRSASGTSSSRRAAAPPVAAAAAAVNDPLTFVSFIAEHPLGAEVEGEVESYTSHGAVVSVGSAQCYLPLANMAVPAPRSARELLKRGERRSFVVTALDPQRRGVELALPGVAVVSGRPSEEMIAAEVRIAKKAAGGAAKKAGAGAAKKAAGGAAKKAGAGAAKKAGAGAKKAGAGAKKAGRQQTSETAVEAPAVGKKSEARKRLASTSKAPAGQTIARAPKKDGGVGEAETQPRQRTVLTSAKTPAKRLAKKSAEAPAKTSAGDSAANRVAKLAPNDPAASPRRRTARNQPAR
ncbi:MAG: NYN domain-containing protein [Acidimicrobiales bacterium]